MPVQMYTGLLSEIARVRFSDCSSGCWFTQEMAHSVSADNTDEGRAAIPGRAQAKVLPLEGMSGGQQTVPDAVAAARC